MVKPDEAKVMALSFEGTAEQPHFNRAAFTVKKKIFATLSFEHRTLNVRFTPLEQMIFCPPGSNIIFPVPGGWGRSGWTTINLDKATKKLAKAALAEAYKLRKGKR